MNTIADKLRARAQEIRARMPGYEIYRSDGELAVKLHDDAGYLETIADELDADERKVKEDYAEERGELEGTIRELKSAAMAFIESHTGPNTDYDPKTRKDLERLAK